MFESEIEKPLVKLEPSKYLTIVPDRDYFLIVQGYRGAMVLVKKSAWKQIIEENNFISDSRSKLQMTRLILLAKEILIPEGIDEIFSIKKIFEEKLVEARKNCYLGLYLTLRCNFACPYCYLDEKQADITKEIIDKSLEDFFEKVRAFKVKSARADFWGGEPLLCLDTLEYAVHKARALNNKRKTKIKFGIVSNGSIFNPRISRLFSKEKDLAVVQIPLDGPKSVHDRRRFFKSGAGSYQIILKNLPLWAKIAKRVVVRVNIDEENKNHIPELLKGLSKLNKKKVSIFMGNVAKGWGRGKARKEVLDICGYKPTEGKLQIMAKKLGFKVVKSEFPRFRYLFCKASGAFSGWIGPDGEKYCCAKVVGNQYYGIGNVVKGCQPEKVEMWLKYNMIRNEDCLKCKHIFFCGGICPADAMQGAKTRELCGSGFKYYLQKNLNEVIKKAEMIN
ncbi:MAG: radical SAM protein [Planctomycetota bacterium]